MTARAFMATLSTAGRNSIPPCPNCGYHYQPEIGCICGYGKLTATNPHPPVTVERWVGDRAGLVGEWVEKRLEWDGEKYAEVEKC